MVRTITESILWELVSHSVKGKILITMVLWMAKTDVQMSLALKIIMAARILTEMVMV